MKKTTILLLSILFIQSSFFAQQVEYISGAEFEDLSYETELIEGYPKDKIPQQAKDIYIRIADNGQKAQLILKLNEDYKILPFEKSEFSYNPAKKAGAEYKNGFVHISSVKPYSEIISTGIFKITGDKLIFVKEIIDNPNIDIKEDTETQDEQEISQTQKKGYVIVSAGTNYEALKKQAKTVAPKLGYKLNLRDLEYHKTEGLSFSQSLCEKENMEYPFYIARGRWDDGEYVSVEYTNAYEGFTPGYYIIVVSSHDKGVADLKTALQHVKKSYKSAYIKYADVYMGCLH